MLTGSGFASRHLLGVQHLVELYFEEVGLLVIRALQARLTVEDRDRIAVELLGALASVSDANGAELAVLGERPDQVEHDPLL